YDHLNDEVHSPLVGFAFDGFPVYGAYGDAHADGTGGNASMRRRYQPRSITDRTTLPDGIVLAPVLLTPASGATYHSVAFLEDHAVLFCVTPAYPDGQYCYFVPLNAANNPAYPYILGPTYYGVVQAGNTGPQSGHNTIPAGAVVYGQTGIPEAGAMPGTELFPVPASTALTVRVNGALLRSVAVLDPQGRTLAVRDAAETQTQVPLYGLAPGGYLVRLVLADGRILVRPMVKE